MILKWLFISYTGEDYMFIVHVSQVTEVFELIEFQSEDDLEIAVHE